MAACNLSQRKVRREIAAQMRIMADRGFEPPRLALEMAAAWKKFRANLHLMRHDWGADTFFGQGAWRDENAWPWDQGRMDSLRNASVGAWRPN